MKVAAEKEDSGKRVQWTNPQIEKLMHWAELLEFDWERVALQIKVKDARQCKQKYISQTSDLRHGKWRPQEDQIIRDWVRLRGACHWAECALKLLRRDGKQCRERWTNVLNPGILKGNWTRFEQKKIFNGMRQKWTRWREISVMLDRRTPNAVKNCVYSAFRSVESSSVAKCIRGLIIFPTYINRSNTARLMAGILSRGSEYQENRISKWEAKTRSNLQEIKQSFEGLNLISQLMLRYLLELGPEKDRFGAQLIGKIYGKNAKKRYLMEGLSEVCPEIKADLTRFALSTINKQNEAERRGNGASDSSEHSNLQDNARILKENALATKTLLNGSRDREPHKKLGEKSADQTKKLIKLDSVEVVKSKLDFTHQTFSDLRNKRLKLLPIELKYIEHWKWLYENRLETGSQLKSFNKMLNQAHLERISDSYILDLFETRSSIN